MVLENQSLSFCLSISAGPGNRSGCTYIRRKEEEARMRRRKRRIKWSKEDYEQKEVELRGRR